MASRAASAGGGTCRTVPACSARGREVKPQESILARTFVGAAVVACALASLRTEAGEACCCRCRLLAPPRGGVRIRRDISSCARCSTPSLLSRR